MKISETHLPGCKVIEPSPMRDDRGYFMRLFDATIFAEHAMSPAVVQTSLSFSTMRGTLRGLHFQAHPAPEDKLVRCGRGQVFDVAVDIRSGSPTFGQWFGLELSDENNLQLFIPAGLAHGFQTLTSDALVLYQIGTPYEATLSAGLRFDDPDVGVKWPLEPVNLSPRDRALPLLRDLSAAILTPFELASQ